MCKNIEINFIVLYNIYKNDKIREGLCVKNQLFYGDNLGNMRKHIPSEIADLVYADPPFNSKRNYNQIYNGEGREDVAQSVAFVDTWTWNDAAQWGLQEILCDEEQRYTSQTIALIDGLSQVLGQTSMLAYIVSMTQRINEIHRILKSTGSFYLHCDPTMSHYLKLVLDSVFIPYGGDFLNEIVWKRIFNHADAKRCGRIHDIIFLYSKSKKYIWNKVYQKQDPEYIEKFYKYKDEKGRIFQSVSMTAGGQGEARLFGDKLLIPPPNTHWRWGQERINEALKKDKIFFSKNGVPRIKYYLDEQKGQPIQDIWLDIPPLTNKAKERLGYPTQKPEKLLERIIKASSNENDIVFDAYCGCGTTVAVAERLKRRWIGIDITFQSISLIMKRLEDTYGKEVLENVVLMGIPQDIESARALADKKDDRLRKEFEKWAILTYSNNRARINEKKGKDYGIDGFAYSFGSASKNKILFSVKSGHVSSSQIRDFRGTIEREKALGGIFITLEPPTKDMLEEAIKAGFIENEHIAQKTNKIEIVTIQGLIDGERIKLPIAGVFKSATRKEKDDWEQLKLA